MIQIPVEPQITDYLHRKAARMGVPLNGTFELTPCCNMACKMCYVRMTEQERKAQGELLTAKQWLNLAKEAKEQGLLYLLLTGGEPFLRKDIQEIVEGLHHMGFVLTMNTNGTLIDESVMEWLKKVPPTRMNITIYGASDETYDRLCGNPRGFTQVKKAIGLLKDAGINVKINCSVTPYNKDDLEKIHAYCQEEDLNWQATSYTFPPLRRDENQIGVNDRFTPEEAAYFSAKIEALNRGKENYLEYLQARGDLPVPPMDDCMEIEGDVIRCRAGRCCFWITWDGKMLPCGMFPASLGCQMKISEEDTFAFSDVWAKVHEDTMSIRMPSRCRTCELIDVCRPCAAMNVTETGRFDMLPEYRCQMTVAYRSQCKILADDLRKE